MISTATASSTTICSEIWFRRHKASFSSGFSSRLPSASRKFVRLTSTFYPIKKDVVHSFQAFEFHLQARVAVDPVIRNESKSNTKTQNLKNAGALASIFKDVFISDPVISSGAKTSRKERNPKRRSSSAAQTTVHLPVIRYPLGTESAIKSMLERNTLVFVVDEHADKNNIKETVKKMFKIRAKKVNTVIMPDGTKKAYIMMAPDCNALDVAKKIKIL